MPVLCLIYLIAPILNIIRKFVGKSTFIIGTLIMLAWAIISAITTTYEIPYSIGNVMSYLTYFMLGYVLYKKKTTTNNNIYIYIYISGDNTDGCKYNYFLQN